MRLLKIIVALFVIIGVFNGKKRKKHKGSKAERMTPDIIHKKRKKHHHKRRLFGMGPKFDDNPKWNMKDLNLTTNIPIVTLDKKFQHPTFIIPQIISTFL